MKPLIVYLMTLVLLIGCTNIKEEPQMLTPITIKVLYKNGEEQFHKDFGETFIVKHPHVNFEVISRWSYQRNGENWKEVLERILTEENPDLLWLFENEYEYLATENKLIKLDPLISRDRFDIDGILPAVTDVLKEKGNGDIFGLSPTFGGRALFYNKALFDEYGVPHPQDKMTWMDTIELAQRFPDESGVCGFYHNSEIADLMFDIGKTENLGITDLDGLKMTINSPNWDEIISQVIKGYKNKDICVKENENAGVKRKVAEEELKDMDHLFLTGRAAMTIGSIRMISDHLNPLKQSSEVMNWGLVTAPVGSAASNQTEHFYLTDIYGINAKTAHVEEVWGLLSFINGEEMAKIKASSSYNSGQLLSRVEWMSDSMGVNLESFYMLDPRPINSLYGFKVPDGFAEEFNTLFSNELEVILNIDEELDIPTMLVSLEIEAQLILDQLSLE
jgi:multiple sugar transport system substrate-binding protein